MFYSPSRWCERSSMLHLSFNKTTLHPIVIRTPWNCYSKKRRTSLVMISGYQSAQAWVQSIIRSGVLCNIVQIVSMSWSSASLKSGTVRSRTLLTWPSVSGGKDREHACVQIDNIFGRPFVKRFALFYQTVVLSVMSVCPVCDVGVLWPNVWTDQDETWHAGRPRPWPHCVRWGPSSPPKVAQPPIFGPYLLRPDGCMDHDATWYGGRLRPRRLRVRWRPRTPKKFRPVFIVPKRPDGSRWYLAWR